MIVARSKPKKVFVDTSAWFSLLVKKDNNHRLVAEHYKKLLDNKNPLITSSLVIGETFTLLRYRHNQSSQKPYFFLQFIEESPSIETVYSSPAIEKKGFSLLEKFHDHRFSFVDATSFALMDDLKIETALTLDNHFSIMGFEVIPSDKNEF